MTRPPESNSSGGFFIVMRRVGGGVSTVRYRCVVNDDVTRSTKTVSPAPKSATSIASITERA